MYSDADAAALYDLLNAWGPSDDFYLALVMDAGAVLDVGCGTGVLLHRARATGHEGRLVGLDPDRAALDRARRRTDTGGADIEWVAGTAASATWDRAFDLAVMASNAFQVFITDDELRASLAAIRTALVDGGRFAFESRNPLLREWENWNPSNAMELVDSAGRAIRVAHEIESVVGDVVTLTETVSDQGGKELRVDRAGLRFIAPDALDGFLAEAGLAVEARYGDFARGPLTDESASIVTVTQRI